MPKIFNENGIVDKMDLSIKRSCRSNGRVDQTAVSINCPTPEIMNRFANYFIKLYRLKYGLKLDSNKHLVNSCLFNYFEFSNKYNI
jgi:hypothetical protein